MGSVKAIELDEAAVLELRALSRGRRVEARLKQRADIVLLAAEGLGNTEIGARVDLDRRKRSINRVS